MTTLADETCVPYEKGASSLTLQESNELTVSLHADWQIATDGNTLQRLVQFPDYYRTICFVNALAYVAHREDHHPSLLVNYDSCRITLDTHTVGGLSRNDFILAAKADRLLAPG